MASRPPFRSGFRYPEKLASVPVPETSLNKDGELIFLYGQIRFTGKAFRLQSVTESRSMKHPSDDQFRIGILAPDRAHVSTSGFIHSQSSEVTSLV